MSLACGGNWLSRWRGKLRGECACGPASPGSHSSAATLLCPAAVSTAQACTPMCGMYLTPALRGGCADETVPSLEPGAHRPSADRVGGSYHRVCSLPWGREPGASGSQASCTPPTLPPAPVPGSAVSSALRHPEAPSDLPPEEHNYRVAELKAVSPTLLSSVARIQAKYKACLERREYVKKRQAGKN